MYAVIESGGKQVKVQEGDTVMLEKLAGDKGDKVTFDNVLLVANGENVSVGSPMVAGASVTGEIVEQGRDKKVIVYKFQRRKNFRKKQGHRQSYTAVKIASVTGA